MMRGGIAAMFAPVSDVSRAHIQALSNAFEVPYIDVAWDAKIPLENYSINLFPDREVLGKANADLIKYWDWKMFTVIYEDSHSE